MVIYSFLTLDSECAYLTIRSLDPVGDDQILVSFDGRKGSIAETV